MLAGAAVVAVVDVELEEVVGSGAAGDGGRQAAARSAVPTTVAKKSPARPRLPLPRNESSSTTASPPRRLRPRDPSAVCLPSTGHTRVAIAPHPFGRTRLGYLPSAGQEE